MHSIAFPCKLHYSFLKTLIRLRFKNDEPSKYATFMKKIENKKSLDGATRLQHSKAQNTRCFLYFESSETLFDFTRVDKETSNVSYI